MRGRKPIPIEIHKLRGNPGKRPLPTAIATPLGRPECPPHVNGPARDCWAQVCGFLETMGILSKADSVALEVLCDSYAAYIKSTAEVEKYGSVIVVEKKNGDKSYRINPYFRVRSACVEQLGKLLCEFGLTPSARARIVRGASDVEDSDPFAQMIRARTG